MIFSETPANPILGLVDLDAVSALAKEHNCLHGCDLVIQSLTKFYCGHNISNGGAVISKTQELHDEIKLCQNMHGNIMAPAVAFNILQTTKTMGLRVRQQSASAHKIAEFLASHPKVTKVVYPGT